MQRTIGLVQATAAMSLVGGAVTASAFLTEYPRFGAQAVRYLAAAAVLAFLALGRFSRSPALDRFSRSPALGRLSRSPALGRARWRIVRPVGAEWAWLAAAATSGLVVYNVAVVRALDSAEPTVVATVVSGVPLALAIGAPLAARRAVPLPLVGAAVVVVAGAALVQGGGRSDLAGLAFASVALAGEVGFTLLGLPVLTRLGAYSIAAHTSWIAAVELTVIALVRDGWDALPRPGTPVVLAIAYLAAASAIAFTLWFLAVDGIGGDLAGLAAGIIPAAAVATGLPLGVATVDARTVSGLVLVAGGLTLGMRCAARGHRVPSAAHR